LIIVRRSSVSAEFLRIPLFEGDDSELLGTFLTLDVETELVDPLEFLEGFCFCNCTMDTDSDGFFSRFCLTPDDPRN